MTQMQMRWLVRLARGGLWLVLVGGPLLLYSISVLTMLVEATGLFADRSDIYIAGQLLDAPRPGIRWGGLGRLPYALLAVAVQVGPSLLLAGVAGALLLGLGGWLMRRRWPGWQLRRPATVAGLAGRLLGLVALAYVLGCVVHLLVPPAWFNSPAVPPGFPYVIREDYLWPYASYAGWPNHAPDLRGWTIYAPGYVAMLGFPTAKASYVKLACLLSTLLFYRHYRRRPHSPAPPESAAAA